MPQLSDPRASRAVLIGSYAYRSLDDLPAVENNIKRLGELLRESTLWGLPQDHCTELLQPTRDAIFDAVHDAAAAATDTLVLYFAGHGLVDPYTGELYLALRDSHKARLDKALRYEDVRRVLLSVGAAGGTRARRKVVILDCCWSGLALGGAMAAVDDVGTRADIEGTFVLTATAGTRQALAPPGDHYTAFTGELIDAVTHGIAGAPELLSMSALYDHLVASLAAKSLPRPQQGNRNTANHISLFRNRAFRPSEPPPPSPDTDAIPSPARRTVRTVLLSLLVTAVAGATTAPLWLDVVAGDEPACATGRLTLAGSTTFGPVLQKAAAAYEETCPGAELTVDVEGSDAALRELEAAGREKGSGSPELLAFSDGLKSSDNPRLLPHPVASSLFTFVIHKNAGVQDLSLAEIQRLYDGVITNWRQLGGNDQPVRLVDRAAASNTRKIFERQILRRSQFAINSEDCLTLTRGTSSDVVRCERSTTHEALRTVARVPGAVGYGDIGAASDRDDLYLVRIDGQRATMEATNYGAYPFWETEYAYTYNKPPTDAVALSFLRFLSSEASKNIMNSYDYRSCAELQNPVPCRDYS
ncbi:substrate-binding domain-containing protein [Streptomyces sp. NPDC058572]|uniref:caspase, EACC1-associated type n=1 Tax=Streptomyces sp. NPDC058572 TaxID=3346546 RepID=UPI00364B97BB